MNQPLISVIIPVYNVEKYLKQCVDSVLHQTYQNFEVILVDDGSTDGSTKMCDEYQDIDRRVNVIHKQNSGVADTRMHGLAHVNGDYFCFLDSDDHFSPDCLEILLQTIQKYKADIVCSSFLYEFSDGHTKPPRGSNPDENYTKVSRGIDILENMLYGRSDFQPSCWGKLFSKSIISNIYFPDYKVGEDFIAALNFYSKAEKVVFINKKLYFYYQNEQSVMHSNDTTKCFERVRSADEIYATAIRIDPALHKSAASYLIEMNLIVLMKLQNSNEKEKLAHISHAIKKYRKTVILDKKAKNRIRISCFVSYFGIRFLCFMKNLAKKLSEKK